jgi:hypothetical protein
MVVGCLKLNCSKALKYQTQICFQSKYQTQIVVPKQVSNSNLSKANQTSPSSEVPGERSGGPFEGEKAEAQPFEGEKAEATLLRERNSCRGPFEGEPPHIIPANKLRIWA